MSFQVIPLDMVLAPNYFAPLGDVRWLITDPNPTTLWFQLGILDALGLRRYITAVGATLTATFMRMDALTSSLGILTSTPQTVAVNATVFATDASLFSLALTTQQIQNIVSGTIQFSLTEGAVVTTWNQNWLIQKSLTNPGC